MNKIFVLFFLTICPFFSMSAYDWQKHVPDWQKFIPSDGQEDTSEKNVFYGPFSKKGYHAHNLTVYGPLSLEDSVIDGSLTIYGPGILENTTVKGSLILFGIINVSNSSLSNIQAATTGIILIDSKAKNIVVLKNSDNPLEQQKVFLKGTTKVEGSITFERGDGIVIIESTAHFSGKVTGGTLMNE